MLNINPKRFCLFIMQGALTEVYTVFTVISRIFKVKGLNYVYCIYVTHNTVTPRNNLRLKLWRGIHPGFYEF